MRLAGGVEGECSLNVFAAGDAPPLGQDLCFLPWRYERGNHERTKASLACDCDY